MTCFIAFLMLRPHTKQKVQLVGLSQSYQIAYIFVRHCLLSLLVYGYFSCLLCTRVKIRLISESVSSCPPIAYRLPTYCRHTLPFSAGYTYGVLWERRMPKFITFAQIIGKLFILP